MQNIRGSFKFLDNQQPNSVIPGSLPGWNDSRQDDYGIYSQAATLNWTLNSTTFVEGSFGHNTHHQEGCSITGGAPNFCDGGHVVNPSGSRVASGFGDLPLLYNDRRGLTARCGSTRTRSRTGS